MIKLVNLLPEKFASKAQQKYMFANKPEAAKKLASKMTKQDYEDLPDTADADLDEDLKKWFDQNKGKGWIDCNTCKRNPKTGRRIKCKACAKDKDRKKYPDCRPTPSKCDDPGRGKSWGKKSESAIEEKKKPKRDACYYKVKRRYKVWPSVYASGALVQCRKKGAKNWGNK